MGYKSAAFSSQKRAYLQFDNITFKNNSSIAVWFYPLRNKTGSFFSFYKNPQLSRAATFDNANQYLECDLPINPDKFFLSFWARAKTSRGTLCSIIQDVEYPDNTASASFSPGKSLTRDISLGCGTYFLATRFKKGIVFYHRKESEAHSGTSPQFDTDKYLKTNIAPYLFRTYNFWLKLQNTDQDQGFLILTDQDYGSITEYQFRLSWDSGEQKLKLEVEDIDANSYVEYIQASPGRFYFASIVVALNECKFYLNGDLKTTITASNSLRPATKLYLGTNGDNHCQSIMDSVSYYDKVLSRKEILEILNKKIETNDAIGVSKIGNKHYFEIIKNNNSISTYLTHNAEYVIYCFQLRDDGIIFSINGSKFTKIFTSYKPIFGKMYLNYNTSSIIDYFIYYSSISKKLIHDVFKYLFDKYGPYDRKCSYIKNLVLNILYMEDKLYLEANYPDYFYVDIPFVYKQWNMVSVSRKNGVLTCYLNTIPKFEKVVTVVNKTKTSNFKLGNTGLGDSFLGYIDNAILAETQLDLRDLYYKAFEVRRSPKLSLHAGFYDGKLWVDISIGALFYTILDSVEIQPENWYLLTLVRKGNKMLIWLNDKQIGEYHFTHRPKFDNMKLTIGGAEMLPSFNGYIDSIVLYDKALSRSEIIQLYKRYYDLVVDFYHRLIQGRRGVF